MTVVLITGAANGMGAATARHLSGLGYTVVGSDIVERPGLDPVDVRDDAAVRAWVRSAHDAFGRIDAVVTFAVSAIVGAVEETEPDEAATIFDINVLGAHRVLRAVLPIMRAQGSGRIVLVSSGAGAIAEPFGGWYSATKAAIERLGEAVRMETAPFGIHTSVLAPGWTVTPIIDSAVRVSEPIDAYTPARTAVVERVTGYLEAGQTAEAVARTVQRILAATTPEQLYLCGSDVRSSFWSRRLLPARLYHRLVRRYYGV
ncbi:SDR family NAD(P)-dependent oxidoreductase [Nocardia arthritidis]|uniref:SDR family NAD(P)-dependent oxidoreductase n=1 Tax=Nocardia arthritidis TaxID=228602 RepID=A0A6G9YBV5_9NOCA|nr:SDR family NAD(P)-dependent oxidoreductase [Nocardia arthritidis]QIS10709.1 SDR family NAD(P)-dependent oxidoreductase [Nocardia arthritidis]